MGARQPCVEDTAGPQFSASLLVASVWRDGLGTSDNVLGRIGPKRALGQATPLEDANALTLNSVMIYISHVLQLEFLSYTLDCS
jgi:hypothetical protein